MSIDVRETTYKSVALLTTSSSPEIEISKYAWGVVAIPTGSTITTLTYFVASPAGTYYAAQDTAGAAVTQTVAADKRYPIPSVLFGASRIQIRANSAGTVHITLKS